MIIRLANRIRQGIPLAIAFCLLASCNPTPGWDPSSSTTYEARTPTEETITPTSTSAPTPTEADFASILPIECIHLSNDHSRSAIHPTSEHDVATGPPDARMNIVAYINAENPDSIAAVPALLKFQANHSNDTRLAFRYKPIRGSAKGELAARAIEAGRHYGSEWAMLVLIITGHPEWASLSIDDFEAWLAQKAGTLAIDPTEFNTLLSGGETAKAISTSSQETSASIVPRTPFIIVNNKEMTLGNRSPSLDEIYRLVLLEDRQFATCPEVTVDPNTTYQAVLHTTRGAITINIITNWAPLTTNSFIFLARSNWYDNVPFFNVLPGISAITGDPSGTGYGTPGYITTRELTDVRASAGLITMAPSGPDHNSSQFSILLSDDPELYSSYDNNTAIGKITGGLNTARGITEDDTLLSVTIHDD